MVYISYPHVSKLAFFELAYNDEYLHNKIQRYFTKKNQKLLSIMEIQYNIII
jgi:hypothetical protein